MPQEPDSRTAPLPAQARNPSASWAASGCGQVTLSTSRAPDGSVAGATHDVCPPGWNGRPSVSDHRCRAAWTAAGIDAAQRIRRREPIINRDVGQGKKFVMSLSANEIIKITENGAANYCRVQKIDNLKHAHHASPAQRLPQERGQGIRKDQTALDR